MNMDSESGFENKEEILNSFQNEVNEITRLNETIYNWRSKIVDFEEYKKNHKKWQAILIVRGLLKEHGKDIRRFVLYLKANSNDIGNYDNGLAIEIMNLKVSDNKEASFLRQLWLLIKNMSKEDAIILLKAKANEIEKKLIELNDKELSGKIGYYLSLINEIEIQYLEKETQNPLHLRNNLRDYIKHIEEDISLKLNTNDKKIFKELEGLNKRINPFDEQEMIFLNARINEIKSWRIDYSMLNRYIRYAEELISKFEPSPTTMGDKDVWSRLEKSEIITHLKKYIEEFNYFKDKWNMVYMGEKDPKWKEFEEFLKNLREEEKTVRENYGDRKNATRLIVAYKNLGEWPEGWKKEINEILEEMKSKEAIENLLQEAQKEIIDILSSRLKGLGIKLEDEYKELKGIITKRIDNLKKDKENAFESLEKMIIKRLKQIEGLDREQLRVLMKLIRKKERKYKFIWLLNKERFLKKEADALPLLNQWVSYVENIESNNYLERSLEYLKKYPISIKYYNQKHLSMLENLQGELMKDTDNPKDLEKANDLNLHLIFTNAMLRNWNDTYEKTEGKLNNFVKDEYPDMVKMTFDISKKAKEKINKIKILIEHIEKNYFMKRDETFIGNEKGSFSEEEDKSVVQ